MPAQRNTYFCVSSFLWLYAVILLLLLASLSSLAVSLKLFQALLQWEKLKKTREEKSLSHCLLSFALMKVILFLLLELHCFLS